MDKCNDVYDFNNNTFMGSKSQKPNRILEVLVY